MSRARPTAAVAAVAGMAALLAGCGGAGATHPAAQPSGRHSPASRASATATASAAPTMVTARVAPWHLGTPSARQALVQLGGGQMLLAGGMLADDTSTGAVSRIDLARGSATPAPSLAVPVHDAAGGTYAGAPAVFGGGNATEQSLVQALHGRRWSRVDSFPTTRSDLSVLAVPGGTLALGGYDGSSVPRQVYLQRGSAPMRPAGSLAVGVRYAATAVVGQAAYVFGGEVAGAELGTVQRLDLATGRTRVVARLPHPLGHAMAVTIGGRVLLMGGHTTPDVRTAAMWWFDPATGRFTRAGRLPRPLSDAAVALDGSTAWLLGGEDPQVTDRVVRVDVG